MKRWNIPTHTNVEKPKVDAFLTELIEVSKRHGLSLAHEDNHGAFIVGKVFRGQCSVAYGRTRGHKVRNLDPFYPIAIIGICIIFALLMVKY